VSVHVPNCKSFLVIEAERKHVRRGARFQKHGDATVIKFFFLQGKAPKEIHAILKETRIIVCHRKKLGGPV